jgi:phosphodiesterase/alkaline phosphatase D-like protein
MSHGVALQALRSAVPALAALALAVFPAGTQDRDGAALHVGSGAKAGEITDRSAIVLVRLTTTPGQDAQGLIPGRAGQARLRYGLAENLRGAAVTGWQTAREAEDFSIQFRLEGLRPASRYFHRVEYRAAAEARSKLSEVFSFVTAPAPGERRAVRFHLTTCQDYCGAGTYVPMAAQHPDFCVSDGDTVYYDGPDLGRTVPQAYQLYQKMFGLPSMKDYYRNVGGYFMKDDHDYRFNDCDPFMKGKWTPKGSARPGARLTEQRGDTFLDEAWLSHEEGIRVFKTVFPMGPRTYRTVRWGRGLQIWLLENRDYRSPNDMPDGPDKTIWGREQKAWLKETLLASDADFRVVISPNPIIGPDHRSKRDNQANLEGFHHEGQEFLDWIQGHGLRNVVLMCGDRHWQYHSIDRQQGRGIHEFGCGPTCDEHIQVPPPADAGIDRTYVAARGGFLAVDYRPDRTLTCQFFSMKGEPLYRHTFGGR